ncbi:MAG: sialate O-acetylesterase, partial [Burkholderiales bacterium]|nr:sialate O-acetylesterase [Opitutaceae bacterium]
MRLLTGLFPQQVLQRDRNDRATVIASGLTTACGPVHAVIKGLRGRNDSRPRLVGVARAGKFSVRLPGLPVGGPYAITLRCGDASLTVP